jgi:hypothetical protein
MSMCRGDTKGGTGLLQKSRPIGHSLYTNKLQSYATYTAALQFPRAAATARQ